MRILTIAAVALALPWMGGAQRKPGSQLDALPANIERISEFGERADISPDSQRIAFMAKSFGDAMVVDLKTRAIRCLTCSVPGAAFLRVMHLPTGDYILIGPDHFENISISRTKSFPVPSSFSFQMSMLPEPRAPPSASTWRSASTHVYWPPGKMPSTSL